MEGTNFWLTPLALLPGVGLLVMSTAARFGQLHAELHHHLEHGDAPGPGVEHLLRRATRFRNALVSLYLSVAALAVASLAGGIAALWSLSVTVPVVVLTAVAVLAVAYAAYELIQESRMLLELICAHVHTPSHSGEPPDR
ncbi:MAG: DUF2721 domain-containing protein [Myxococcota bacterium]